ncbi:hypothetical protein [Thermomonas flagellata]|uniref:hypothetical protein n=1 Tax=Thermomonas flagellata TaxID=2888524 RepID=UPI001F03D3A6|nr:hypothetical protein [Thermomonas flagellata]
MKRYYSFALVAIFLGSMSLTAFAQSTTDASRSDSSGWDKIVLEDKSGSVMVSTGGDYQMASAGQQLAVGQRMMLTGGDSMAKVVYYKLDRDGRVVQRCVKDYRNPETYIIDASCVAAGWADGARNAGGGAIIAGAAVAGALLLNSAGNVPTQPGAVSACTR